MKYIKFAILLTAGICFPLSAQNIDCSVFDGAVVLNNDGEYLGTISNRYESESIFNKYGSYGSKYSLDSILNKYGKNGSEYQVNSAFNRYSSDPPKIIKDRQIIGYLTANRQIRGAVNPTVLGVLCYEFEPPR